MHDLEQGSMTEHPKLPGMTAFLAEHKRRPTARQDGISAWLRDQIEYLEDIERTPFGDGSLSAYKSTLEELECANV